MKIDIRDPSQIMSRIVLHNTSVAEAVAETADWKDSKTITAEIKFNGVVVPTEVAESVFKEMYAQVSKNYAWKYADIEKEVQRRVEQRMKDEATPILEKMYKLQSALEEAENTIKPYWDK